MQNLQLYKSVYPLDMRYMIYKDISLSTSFTYIIGVHVAIDNTSYEGFKFGFGF